MFPNNANIPCCFDIIDSLFREKIPLLLQRVQFMSNKQQEGQDGISWREELHNLSDDAAIEEMQTTPQCDRMKTINIWQVRWLQ